MKQDKRFLSTQAFEQRTQAGIAYLLRTIEVNNGQGSSAWYSRLYHPLGKWQNPYPETTGYIIETLYDYSHHYQDAKLSQTAKTCADWICTLELEGGALPGGFHPSKAPSIFNTGQMIFGLVRAYLETNDQKYIDVAERAVHWLVSVLEEDGSWRKGAYVEGFIPSYYTRVIWAVLYANQVLKNDQVEQAMRKALAFYAQKISAKKTVEDWSFKAGQRAFTHTIAYTIRGFQESAFLLNDEELLQKATELAEKIMRLREIRGRLSGWYDADWKGSDWFTCVTGNAQLSIILSRFYQHTKDLRYLNTSLKIFGDIVDTQNLSQHADKRGAIPGSSPFWGRYLAFRYPNWATKFYLDAYLLLFQEVHTLEEQVLKENKLTLI